MRYALEWLAKRGPALMSPDKFCAKYLFWFGVFFYLGGIALIILIMIAYPIHPPHVIKIAALSPFVAGHIMILAAYGIQAMGHESDDVQLTSRPMLIADRRRSSKD